MKGKPSGKEESNGGMQLGAEIIALFVIILLFNDH